MKYSLFALLFLCIALPCRGQEDPYYSPNASTVVILAEPPVAAPIELSAENTTARLPQVDQAATLPPPAQTEEPADLTAHKEDCGCNTCAGRGRRTSGWNFYQRFKTWWETEGEPYMIDTHWGYEPYFEERPFGSFVEATLQTQIVNGTIDQLVLYEYDFKEVENPHQLRPRGYQQLSKIWQKAQCLSEPIVIEKTADDDLNSARRTFVVNVLVEQMGLSADAADNFVRVDDPTAFGLARGSILQMRSEPEIIWYNQLRNTDQQGRVPLQGGADGGTAQ